MIRIFFYISIIAVCSANAIAAVSPSDFPFQKTLNSPEAIMRNVASVELDEEVFLQTASNYSNARIYDGNNVETPFLIRSKRRKKSVIQEYTMNMENVSLHELPDNRIEIVIAQKDQELAEPGVIIFSTEIKNFEKQVNVYGSNDKVTWDMLIENKPIFDYSRFFDIQNKRVEIPKARYRYYKLMISNISQRHDSPIVNIAKDTRKDGMYSEIEKTSFMRKDFRIERIRFLATKVVEVKTSQVKRGYTVHGIKCVNTDDNKKTVVTFSLDNIPLTKLSILTDDSNFSRSVQVEGSDNNDNIMAWKHVTSGTITKIRMGKFNQNNISVNFNKAVRFKHYRLTITNHDSPPLTINDVQAEGDTHEAVFFCKEFSKYRLLYGGVMETSPKYDIYDVLLKTDGEDTDAYMLGVEDSNPEYISNGRLFRINSRTLMIVVILIMIVVLLWVITKMTKNIDQLMPTNPPSADK